MEEVLAKEEVMVIPDPLQVERSLEEVDSVDQELALEDSLKQSRQFHAHASFAFFC
jgi:hypothetical protein